MWRFLVPVACSLQVTEKPAPFARGSRCGGRELQFPGAAAVFFGDQRLEMVREGVARTPKANPGIQDVFVRAAGAVKPARFIGRFEIAADTPIVETFGPTAGFGGDVITFQGRHFRDGIQVLIDGQPCEIRGSKSDMFFQCVLPPHAGGLVDVAVALPDFGAVCFKPAAVFQYLTEIESVESLGGSFAGGGALTIIGRGFHPKSRLFLCEKFPCVVTSGPDAEPAELHDGDTSYAKLTCRTEPATQNVKTCGLLMVNPGGRAVRPGAFTYSKALTPLLYNIEPRSGPKTGGFRIKMVGWKLGAASRVLVCGELCPIIARTADTLECEAPAVPSNRTGPVEIQVPEMGLAKSSVEFVFGPPPVAVVTHEPLEPLRAYTAELCDGDQHCPVGWRCCRSECKPICIA